MHGAGHDRVNTCLLLDVSPGEALLKSRGDEGLMMDGLVAGEMALGVGPVEFGPAGKDSQLPTLGLNGHGLTQPTAWWIKKGWPVTGVEGVAKACSGITPAW